MKTGLLLEGGAMRGMFTAGVLDYFLDSGMQFKNIMTTSAGAYAAMNYIAGQRGRCLKTSVEPFQRGEGFIGLKTFFSSGGNLFDMNKLFEEYPNHEYPFDYDAFFKSDVYLQVSTTNCVTGKAEYFDEFGDAKRLMSVMRASNSLPLISQIVPVDGVPMLDGGMIDPIPIYRALEDKWDKIVVVLTQKKDYRKNAKSLYSGILHLLYRQYPEFLCALKGRPRRYNAALEIIAEMEQQGRIFAIYPEVKPVKNNETNPEKLLSFYQHGYQCMKDKMHQLNKYLEG